MKTPILFFLVIGLAWGKFSWGSCPKVTLQSNFELERYMGTWYEILRTKDANFEKGDCVRATYTLNDTIVLVENSGFFNGTWDSVEGYAYCEEKRSGQCYVKFSEYAPAGDYEVVSTDYENFVVVFSCFSSGVGNWRYAWLLGRTPTIDITPHIALIESLGVKSDELYKTRQTDCPAFVSNK
jgi:apolipoprotein D and lipocalin family protein